MSEKPDGKKKLILIAVLAVVIIIGIVLIPIFHWGAFPLIIMAYLIISLIYHALIKLHVL